MKINIESTTKIVELNGIPARIWEGETSTGIKVHCYITRIAIDEKESDEIKNQFGKELSEQRKPSPEIEAIPMRMVL